MKFINSLKFFLVILLVFINTQMGMAFCFVQPPQIEIKKFFEEQEQCLNQAKVEPLKRFYAENYQSNDGFNKKSLFELYEHTIKNHPDIKYTIKIKSLNVEGDYATVQVFSTATATTLEKSPITGDNADLYISANTIFYLKKNGKNWQIVNEKTLFEKTCLLYGSCKNIHIKLIAPSLISEGEEYTATIQVPLKYSKIAMASIKKDLITYPAKDSKEIYKLLDREGVLERVFRANTTGKNESVAVSLAVAGSASNLVDLQDIKVEGLGIYLQRVNVMPKCGEMNEK